MAPTSISLPGDEFPKDVVPNTKSSKTLTIGPGLKFNHPSTIEISQAGTPSADSRKNTVWLDNYGSGRYVPAVGDNVIAVVHQSQADNYYCTVSPHAPHVVLPHLAFEGVTRKTRPMLQAGSVVYARVCRVERYFDPELECVQSSTGKAEGLGELKGGNIFDINLGMARRLLMNKPREDGKVSILEDLGEGGLRFEVAVGRNGKVWIDSDNPRTTIAIGDLLQKVDCDNLTLDEQEKYVKQLRRSFL